jgi:hypothetical protein
MSSALSKGAVQKVQFTRERELFDQLSSYLRTFPTAPSFRTTAELLHP